MSAPAARGVWHRAHEIALPAAAGGGSLAWTGPALMGVLNVTPDSFSDGGRWADAEAAIAAGRRMAEDGALLVDVGGESSRPGAAPVAESEELRRIVPVVRGLTRAGVRVSIDTTKPAVADAALAEGAVLVNDIRGLRDPALRAVCAAGGASAVAMHMQGEPRTMQHDPHYDDVLAEVEAFLLSAARVARADGVPTVLIDPGIGFGKRVEHNLALLQGVGRLAASGLPVLVGASRKSLLRALAGAEDPAERLPGTLVLHLAAARGGAAMLRVHDVAAHLQALRVAAALDGAVGWTHG